MIFFLNQNRTHHIIAGCGNCVPCRPCRCNKRRALSASRNTILLFTPTGRARASTRRTTAAAAESTTGRVFFFFFLRSRNPRARRRHDNYRFKTISFAVRGDTVPVYLFPLTRRRRRPVPLCRRSSFFPYPLIQ